MSLDLPLHHGNPDALKDNPEITAFSECNGVNRVGHCSLPMLHFVGEAALALRGFFCFFVLNVLVITSKPLIAWDQFICETTCPQSYLPIAPDRIVWAHFKSLPLNYTI